MKSFQHIGLIKACRFLWTSLYIGFLHICFIPQARVFFLRLAGAKIGKDSIIMNVDFTNAYHYGFRTLKVGERVFIGDGVMLDLRGSITLENNVTISNKASVVTHINVGFIDHPLQKYYPTKESRVTVKTGCYIGTAAILLPGIIVGREAVIAAGAVVVRDVPSKTVVGGVPAKILKKVH